MIEKGGNTALYSSKTVAKNTIYNLLGMGLPLILAIFLIPLLINGFGEEKFGILNLAWVVIGYFSFLDFGIGRTLTKIVAEKLGLGKDNEIHSVFWTSMVLISGLSLAGMVIFFLFSPMLVYDILNISAPLQLETLHTFYLLALSVPVVTISAGLRGVLEAYQKFGLINIIRIILGIFTLVGPLLCLIFTTSLFWVVLILVLLRLIVWFLYLIYCLKLNEGFAKNIKFNPEDLNPILKLSGWMTLTNMISPIIIYADRFMIGALLSATAITYFATPLELVSRILLIPTAIVGVLFPVFSASYLANPDYSRRLYRIGIKFIVIIVFPVVLLLVTFAGEGMELWLGGSFAAESTLVLQLLSIGVLFNSIAYFPFTFLQSTGNAQVPAIVLMIELPLYIFAMWFGITRYGITGAAVIWMGRMLIDSAVLFYLTNRILKFKFTPGHLKFSLIFIMSVIPFLTGNITIKAGIVIITILLFVFFAWNYFLQSDERIYIQENILRKSFYA